MNIETAKKKWKDIKDLRELSQDEILEMLDVSMDYIAKLEAAQQSVQADRHYCACQSPNFRRETCANCGGIR